MAAACTAGFAPTEAAYSSPHIQSELVTDHLHFSRADSSEAIASGNDGSVPCQAVAGNTFEGDCRTRLEEAGKPPLGHRP